MINRIVLSIVFSFFIFYFSLSVALAAPVTQSFVLTPGWNAVFLEVEPASKDPGDIFGGVADLQSVWMWNPHTGTVEFIQNPDTLTPGKPQMLAYIPGNPVVTNLHAIYGNTAYLIKLGGTSDVNLTVTGEPKVPMPNWKPNSFNFVGFHVSPGQEPFFIDFFSNSPAHNGQEIYILDNATSEWVQVTNPTVQMKRGEAFWVYCKGSSEFSGPLSAHLEQSTGLHYGKIMSEQDIFVRNESAAEKSVTFSISSLHDAFHHWVFKPADNVAGWVKFPASISLTIPAGESQKLRLGVKRASLEANRTYHANMEITDNEGMTILVPASAAGIGYSGLWVGYTTLNKVSEPANTVSPNTEVATGSEFSFRLILHADDSGTVRLLSQVIQMWQEGTWKPDPNNLGRLIVDEPGHFVLFADDALIPNYSGAAMRDGQLVGRRVSSPAFPSLTPSQGGMTGSAASGGTFDPSQGNDLSIQITLARDDPSNPFRHLFHPDHKVPEQSYEIVRNLTLTFSDEDPEGRPITGVPGLNWGSSEIGGIITEGMIGLHRKPLYTKGTFLLRKVSNVGTLTMQ